MARQADSYSCSVYPTSGGVYCMSSYLGALTNERDLAKMNRLGRNVIYSQVQCLFELPHWVAWYGRQLDVCQPAMIYTITSRLADLPLKELRYRSLSAEVSSFWPLRRCITRIMCRPHGKHCLSTGRPCWAPCSSISSSPRESGSAYDGSSGV